MNEPLPPQGIEALNLEGIASTIAKIGQPKFRGKQLIQWIYSRGATSYDEMTNLPKGLRETLARSVPLNIPIVVDKQVSRDGSRKYVLELADGAQVEAVGIPSLEKNHEDFPRRLSVCFSTQVGCPMQCAFCATGKEGFTRNLLPGEMVQQILTVQRDFAMKVTNVVAMGQGEPFLNYRNVIDALHIINHPDGLNIGARHITVSTCGVIQGIDQFAHEPEQFTLAVSLHSAIQDTRNRIMPQCKAMPLVDLKRALRSYYEQSTRRPSFEYLMIDGVNDSDADLQALAAFCEGLPVHINLIPLNHIEGSIWIPSDKKRVQYWVKHLKELGIDTNLRNSRGADIAGACGQLKNARS